MAFGNVHPCSFSLPPIHVGHPALFQAVLPTVLERTRSLGTLRSAGRHGHPGAPWLPLDSHGLEQPCLSLAFWEVLSKRRTGREGRAGSRCQGPLMISLVTCVSLDSFLEQIDRLCKPPLALCTSLWVLGTHWPHCPRRAQTSAAAPPFPGAL